MQTLGLASEQKPTDGMLKRLFWPTIENQYDVDLVRVQGFWLCLIVAVLSAGVLIASSSPRIGLLVCLTYVLAGIGVREGSMGAAALIFLCYLFDRLVAVEGMVVGFGGGSPVVGLFALALLLSNVRGTLLSRRWQRATGNAVVPDDTERSATSLGDKLVNVVPAAVWPKGQYVFFPLAAGLLLLTLATMVMLPGMQRRRAAQIQQQLNMQVREPAN